MLQIRQPTSLKVGRVAVRVAVAQALARCVPLPLGDMRRQCGQANERDIGRVVVTSRSVVIGARGEAPVGQHALCADPI